MIKHDQVGFIPEMCLVIFLAEQMLNISCICFKKENKKNYHLPSLSPSQTPILPGYQVEAEPRSWEQEDALIIFFL